MLRSTRPLATLRRRALCFIIVLSVACAAKAPSGPTPDELAQARAQRLGEIDRTSNAECMQKLQKRELPTNRSFVECYGAKVRPAYSELQPENVDLFESLLTRWSTIADQLDAGKIRAAAAMTEMAKIKSEVESEAQRRAAAVTEAEDATAAAAAAQQSRSEEANKTIETKKQLDRGLSPSRNPPPGGGGGTR